MSRVQKLAIGLSGFLALSACENGFDFDLRDLGNGFDTSDAARNATANRPQADNRGVISYPNYQVAVAKRGDSVADVARRVGLTPNDLARHNGLKIDQPLRDGEVLALPRRVAEPSAATGAVTAGPLTPGAVDITTLAGDAINRATTAKPGHATTPQAAKGVEPIRHKVERGETAFTISRLYNVSVRALAEWNGLGADLAVREGQFLLIPVVIDSAKPQRTAAVATTTIPGAGSPTPEPPSAATPLPNPSAAKPANAPKPATPPSPKLGGGGGKMAMPVAGSIIREFSKGKSDGIDIAAPAGTSVVAAADGTVAAVTRDTDQVPILVLRHPNNLLTVYAGVDGLKVKKGDSVKRGQRIAVVRKSNPSFLHFEVRKGLESVDPMRFIQ